MPIKHGYTATGSNDPTKQVSVTRWNDDHTLDQYLDFPVQATDPAAPAADLRLYSKSRAGRRMLNMIGPTGVDVGIQPAFFGNTITMYTPGGGQQVNSVTATVMNTTSLVVGNVGTSWVSLNGGTATATLGITNPAITTTSAYTRMRRTLLSTGTNATSSSSIFSGLGNATIATANSVASLPETGFFMYMRFAVDTYLSSIQMFLGLTSAVAAQTTDPSTWTGSLCGIGKDTADTTWQIMTRNGTTTTKTATGVTPTAGQILDFTAFMPPSGTSVTYLLKDAITGTVYVNNVVVTATQPTGALAAKFHIRSTTGTTAKILALNKFYLETDI